MNRNYIWFLMGVAAGSLTAWWYLKRHYDNELEDEIKGMELYYEQQVKSGDEKDEFLVRVDENDENTFHVENKSKTALDEITEYAKKRAEERNTFKKPEPEPREDVEHPYVITPEEFGEFEEYETISLTYYIGDDVLADENDEIIENVDEVVGHSSLGHFGEYEDDSVYVRNDKFKCDYEILLDNRTYVSMLREKLKV